MKNTFNTFITYKSFIYIITFFTFISCKRSDKDTELFFIQGNVAYKKGNYEEAIKFYTEAIEKSPDFADAYNNRGSVQLELQNPVAAIADFEKAVSIDNQFFQAKYNLGETYSTIGEYEKSLNVLKQLESKYKDSSYYHVLLSTISIKKNNFSEANLHIQDALRLNKNSEGAYTNLGFIQYSEKNYKDAKANFEKVLSLNPKQDLAYNNLSLIYANEENFSKAIEMVNKAIEINKNALYENNKGFYLLNSGNLEEAKSLIEKAIEADAKNAWAYRNLGIYYFMKNDFKQALENFDKTDKLDPSVEMLNYYLGLTQKSLGNNAKACQYWEIGKKLNEQKSIEMLGKICK